MEYCIIFMGFNGLIHTVSTVIRQCFTSFPHSHSQSLAEGWCHRWTHQSDILRIILLFVCGIWQPTSQYQVKHEAHTREIIQMFATAGVYTFVSIFSLKVHSRERSRKENRRQIPLMKVLDFTQLAAGIWYAHRPARDSRLRWVFVWFKLMSLLWTERSRNVLTFHFSFFVKQTFLYFLSCAVAVAG